MFDTLSSMSKCRVLMLSTSFHELLLPTLILRTGCTSALTIIMHDRRSHISSSECDCPLVTGKWLQSDIDETPPTPLRLRYFGSHCHTQLVASGARRHDGPLEVQMLVRSTDNNVRSCSTKVVFRFSCLLTISLCWTWLQMAHVTPACPYHIEDW